MNESIKDRLLNTDYYLASLCREFFKIEKYGKNEPDVSKMKLVLDDNFNTFNTNNWRIGQPWGEFHPDYLYEYYGKDSVYVKNNHLVCDNRYQPQKFINNGSEVTIPFSIGIITSQNFYGYGFYQFVVKLPIGVGLWPAVWLTGSNSWPPEIDINESYSDANGDYDNNLQSNLHFNIQGPNIEDSGPRNHPIYDITNKITFSCWWTKDFIKIYYNGYLVRSITSDYTLKWFRDKQMMIVLGTGIQPGYVSNLPTNVNGSISNMEIYSAKVWQD